MTEFTTLTRNPSPTPSDPLDLESDDGDSPACVLSFNVNDPTGAGGLTADVAALASVGVHALPIMTGAYARDTSRVLDHFGLDEEAVTDQARAVLEDVPVQVIKVGFVGSPDVLGTIASISADYPEVPVVAYMPDLSWWDVTHIEAYLDAFADMLLSQTAVLVGSYGTLRRWLLPDWSNDKAPTARDIARAASELGAACTFVTGIPLPDQHVDNVLASAQSVLFQERFERFEAQFSGAGDTVSAALAGLLATGSELPAAAAEALSYLDNCLNGGFRPGMGGHIPDRFFWAQPDADTEDPDLPEPAPPASSATH